MLAIFSWSVIQHCGHNIIADAQKHPFMDYL